MKNTFVPTQRGPSLLLVSLLAAALLTVLFLQGGCAPTTTAPQRPKPFSESEAREIYGRGPARGLIEEASRLLKEGQSEHAEMVMERAQRIEPSNPLIWYTMGKIKYRRGQCGKAIQFLLKSRSLSANDGSFSAMNDRLLAQAQGCR